MARLSVEKELLIPIFDNEVRTKFFNENGSFKFLSYDGSYYHLNIDHRTDLLNVCPTRKYTIINDYKIYTFPSSEMFGGGSIIINSVSGVTSVFYFVMVGNTIVPSVVGHHSYNGIIENFHDYLDAYDRIERSYSESIERQFQGHWRKEPLDIDQLMVKLIFRKKGKSSIQTLQKIHWLSILSVFVYDGFNQEIPESILTKIDDFNFFDELNQYSFFSDIIGINMGRRPDSSQGIADCIITEFSLNFLKEHDLIDIDLPVVFIKIKEIVAEKLKEQALSYNFYPGNPINKFIQTLL